MTVNIDSVQVVTGASEALLILFWSGLVEIGANVVLPNPGFTTFSALPESLGIEARYYALRKEDEFRIDIDEIKKLADKNTKLVLYCICYKCCNKCCYRYNYVGSEPGGVSANPDGARYMLLIQIL